MEQRLQVAIARAGLASRREAERLIHAGRVRVNGAVVTTPGAKVDPGQDVIEVDGARLAGPEQKAYIMLNKPAGYVTSTRDRHARRLVIDLVPRELGRLYPAGRLDADTEGLLLLTNDGRLAFALTHPRHEVNKAYVARVRGRPSAASLEALRRGVSLEDGPTAPAGVRVLKAGARESEIELTIHEGRKRQVKRMCAAVGHPVVGLRRTRLGPLTLGDLGPGEWRPLTEEELRRLESEAYGNGNGGNARAWGGENRCVRRT